MRPLSGFCYILPEVLWGRVSCPARRFFRRISFHVEDFALWGGLSASRIAYPSLRPVGKACSFHRSASPTQTHFTGLCVGGRLTAAYAGGSGDPPLRGNFGPAWYGGSPSAAEDRFSCHFVGEGLAPPVISLEGLSLYAVGVGHRPARRVTTAEIRSRAIRRARLVLHRANPPAQRESGTFSGPPPAGRVDFFKMPLTFPLVEGVS